MTAFKALQEQNRFSTVHGTCMTYLDYCILYIFAVYLNKKTFQFNFSHDAMDSFYDYIWDVTILEYLTRILEKISSFSDAEELSKCTSLNL